MRPTKKKTLQSFGARKRAMKLVRAARLSARTCADGDRADGTCGAASASSTQESGRIDAPSNGTPAPPVQEFVVTSVPGVSCSSTVASASSLSSASRAIASSTVHLRTSFLTCEEKEAADQQRAAVQKELGAMPATERKFEAMECDHEAATATSEGEKFFLVQMDALDDLLSRTPCHRCTAIGMKVRGGTQLGLATKLELVCLHCGVVSSSWSSSRQDDTKAFDVNVRAIMATKQIGKGHTALNDFWAAMNVSHRGLHHKTFQKHLKKFREPQTQCIENFYAESASAVKATYNEMDQYFSRDITVCYDGTWHKRGHTSHIGVGAIIEYHTGLILDAVVLSNQCLGCQVGPKPGDADYACWLKNHVCQKNTDSKSGRMEVEAAIILFSRSLSKHNLRYTTLVSDGDSATFSALVQENVYGLVPISKEECLNHVQKRMGTALRNLVQKSDKALGGKGRLTKALIDKLTDYYGWALRNNSDDVAAMRRAVMASYHHVTSTDEEPHHDLCPEGADSWCRHNASKITGVPPPKHSYKLPRYVADALLPIYERLSQASLLQRCLGAKTQNASESFHSVLWSLMPKEQHASLSAVETALHDAVLRYNGGCYRATQELASSVGLTPGHLAIQRAAEKNSLRLKKAKKRSLEKMERRQRKRVPKDTSSYAAGSF
ncbi:uncharacterized protein LOC142765273 [Rhipicephalus microplus]|uniref:uncharacterized protein LOC142765273 n=1 Tax=Rhipicephalus microplus TaxID=6941 RepID=UPI003F6AF356